MNRPALFGLVVTLALSAATPAARGDVISFDDLSDGGSGTPIANGYGGFNWTNFSVLNTATYYANPSGYANGTTSPTNIAYNAWGAPALITAATPFNFVGGNFAAAWNDGLQLRVVGYSGGNLVGDNTYTLGTSGASWLNVGLNGIDTLLLISSGGKSNSSFGGSGDHFVLDDFTYTFGETPPVIDPPPPPPVDPPPDGPLTPAQAPAAAPEPGSLVLFGLGAGGLGLGRLIRRRRS